MNLGGVGRNISHNLSLMGVDVQLLTAYGDDLHGQRITSEYLAGKLPLLQNAQLIVADTNIPTESLIYLAENCTPLLFCDPVSTTKAEKLRPILPKIYTLKPNRLEAELLSGIPITCKEDVTRAADKLLEMGVHRLFLSLGADGVLAALVWAYLEGSSLRTTALAGLAAGAIAMESDQIINLL